jgi:hypothetical protein
MKPFIDYVSKLQEDERQKKIDKLVELKIALNLLDESKKDKFIEKVYKWDDERLEETLSDLVVVAEKTLEEDSKEEPETVEEPEKKEDSETEGTEEETTETEDNKDETEDEKNEENKEDSEGSEEKPVEDEGKSEDEDVNSKDEGGIKKVDKDEDIEDTEHTDEEKPLKSKYDRLKEILNLD